MFCFKCDGQGIECTKRPVAASDYIDVNEASFEFCERWAGMVKVAQFTQKQNGKDETYNSLIDEKGICKIPNELTAGRVRVSAFGALPGETPRITTTATEIFIDESGFVPGGKTPIPPTPDLYAQLLAEIKKAGGIPEIDATLSKEGATADAKATGDAIRGKLDASKLPEAINAALKKAKESGEFDGVDGAPGKDGAPGVDGAPGKDGHTPQKGIDFWTEADKSEIVNDTLAALPIWAGGAY